ncbi:hypothetical protein UFOVP449_168 [uncultured Caudovirales phage]|uniref:Uncharacterized protein n=1 Tax=uncultured Caudovirales phage TaxID=2100421 RepID=A0A6J5MI71_9CAUD|nr:hypothetical protein UFOVP449_168 [uncultured Caudovirales phage]
MKNKIAFIYNPYIYFESYKNVLNNLRKHYPNSDVFIYFDSFRNDIQKYSDIAYEHNCIFNIRQEKLFYINREDPIEINRSKITEWLNRVKSMCEKTDADWILQLEDDVIIKRKIKYFPSTDVGTNREYFRPGGGSIFKREIFLESIKKTNILDIMQNVRDSNWAGDLLLEHIFRNNNVQYEKWNELAEPGYYDYTDHAVFHGYKELHKLG